MNSKIKVVVKYPNWYAFYQVSAYNVVPQPQILDGVFTAAETRDPAYSAQNLQSYQSYSIFRYLTNVAPGENGGGWIDPLRRDTLNRCAQQPRLTLLAGAADLTLFHCEGLLCPA